MCRWRVRAKRELMGVRLADDRSEEHTSELQSHSDLVCRLLLGKKEHTSELQSHRDFACRLLLTNKQERTSRRIAWTSGSSSRCRTNATRNLCPRKRTSVI